jgi:hypothetical protein
MTYNVIRKEIENTYYFWGMAGGNSAASAPSTNAVFTWNMPPNITIVNAIVVGGGGGGGGTSTSNTTAGGAGGTSGQIVTGSWSADYLPSVLYIQCGSGGNTSLGANGLSGTDSWIALDPAGTYKIIDALGGAGGLRNISGTPSAIGSNTVPYYPSTLVTENQWGGQQQGANGALGTGAQNILGQNNYYVGIYLVSGGAGGGANTSNGGFVGVDLSIPSTVNPSPLGGIYFPKIVGGAGGNGTGSMGANGMYITTPSFMSYGGAGGGGNGRTGGGTSGGTGGPGSGGGGSGAGAAGEGTGGPGGGGFVIITCW